MAGVVVWCKKMGGSVFV